MFYTAYYQFPLLLGTEEHRPYDLFRDLTEIKNGDSSLEEIDFDSHLDGLKVCKLSIRYKEGKCAYWIDISRGCVPLRIQDHYNKTGSESIFVFSDLEHVPNGGWLPRSRLCIIQNGALVNRLVVTQIDTQNKPQPSVFQLEFPEPIPLVNRTRNLVSSGRKTWSLLNLPNASSSGTRAFPRVPAPPQAMPGEIDPGALWDIIVLAIVIVCLIVGSIVVLRRRRRRLQGV